MAEVSTNALTMLAIVSTFVGCAVLVVLLRVFVRLIMLKMFGADDYVMVAATLCALGSLVCFIGKTKHGVGMHNQDIPKDQMFTIKHWVFWHNILVTLSISLVKIFVGCFLVRVVPQKGYQLFLYSTIVFLALFTLTCLVTLIWACIPIRASWEHVMGAKCFTPREFTNIGLLNSCINITTYVFNLWSFSLHYLTGSISDILFATLPVPIIWKLHANLDFGDSLLCRPWWGRAWVVQEFVMACNVDFVCGYDSMKEDLFFLIPAAALHLSLNMFSREALDPVEARNRTAIHLMMAAKHEKRTRQVKDDLSHWIYMFHGWDCEQELDRVYAYMGMVESCSIVPKYELKHRWWEVYEEVAYQIITDKSQFDFAFLGQGESKFSKVPKGSAPASWVPDLSLPYGTMPVLPQLGINGIPVFRASGGSTFNGCRTDGKVLVHGTRVARIREITKVHDEEGSQFFASKKIAYGPEATSQHEPYPHKLTHTREVAFARTLCWDLNYDRERCRPGDTFVERDERTPPPPDFKVDLAEPSRSALFEAKLHVAANSHRVMRKFAVLDEDYMAMVPPNAEKDDWVTILSGASVPIVMRQNGSVYTFIGACYVHGIMDGELWHERGATDTFLLC